MEKARVLMIQGTASSVGKSVLCSALCRVFKKDGFRVAPFKAQNMSSNTWITPLGEEIAAAQGVQAEAAGITPTVDMNPILIKPKQDTVSEVIVRGKTVGDMRVDQYYAFLPELEAVVRESLESLVSTFDIVVIEGAGSPAEVNLRDKDIVNMKTAEMAGAPVILVGNIDRGGVFASIIGTMELLEPCERERVKGFVINKFRGDISLLEPGLRLLEERTGKKVFGVIPYLDLNGMYEEDGAPLPAENSGTFGDIPQDRNLLYDRLADDIRANLDMEAVYSILREKGNAV